MNIVVPAKLSYGDSVAAISLSWGGAAVVPKAYSFGKKNIEELLNITIVPTPNALRSAEWLDRNPQARADDLHWALNSHEIKGIISIIGGDDLIRVAKFIDTKVISNNPKIFLGFSDSTIAHQLFLNAGVESYYGPALLAGFAEEGGVFEYTVNAVRNVLFDTKVVKFTSNEASWSNARHAWHEPENFCTPRPRHPFLPWRLLHGKDTVRGRIFGGCLEVLAFSFGTYIWPKLKELGDIILFLETSEEAPRPEIVARFLRTMASAGILKMVKGIIFGRPGGESISQNDFMLYDEMILKVLIDEEKMSDVVIFTCVDIGHTDPMMVVPYGRETIVDPSSMSIEFL